MVSYVVAAPSPQVMPVQVIRQRYSPPPSPPPPRDASARRPSRDRSASRPKKIDVRELEDKFKELQQQSKKDDSEKREQDRQQRRQAVSNQQTLLRQQRAAERDVQRRELEVDRLESGLHKVDKETRLKSAKQSETVGKIDDTLKRLEGRQQELELQLEEKVKESAVAKGRLAHIEFANTLLTQGQVAVAVDKQLDSLASEGEGAPMAGAIIRASAGLTAAEREQQLTRKTEELRAANRRRTEDNARLRKQLDEIRTTAYRQPKPLFACLGGQLGSGTFYNLWDEGLDTHLGPAFSFVATIRYDAFRRGSKVFDFGCGAAEGQRPESYSGADNIYVGNRDETNTLVFAVYKGRNGSFLTINDFWVPGETSDYLFVLTAEGHMKVYCDGDLVGSRKGQTMRTTERRNLYVGRSNWPSDEPFEGAVSNIKVWSRAVEWSSTDRPIKASPAESWAREHPPAAATAESCTYPNGTTLAFAEFSPALAPLVIANQAHRERILKDIECANHTQVAARVYQSRGWDLEGNLAWRSGEVGEFITLVFQELSLVPPNESQLYPIYAKFATEWSNELAALECLCLADAVLRTVFHSEEAKENELPRGSPGRSSSAAAPASTYASSGELVATSSMATTSARSPMRTPVITPAGQHFVQDAFTPKTQAPASIAAPARLISAEYPQKTIVNTMASVQAARLVREVPRGAWETPPTMLIANA